MIGFIPKIISLLIAMLTVLISIFNLPAEKNVKNVILLIGDGMGEMHLDMTEELRDVSLAINTMPQKGYSMTYSANKAVTDSAAGGTALACGVKTSNGTIGMYWGKDTSHNVAAGNYPRNITEVCRDNGMKTGVVSSDKLSGATPAAFTAHTESRDNDEDITLQQLETGFDIMWGKTSKTLIPEQVTEAGYTYVSTLDEMNALTADEKSYAMFTSSLYHTYNKNSYTPTLSQMTSKAIELLDTDNKNGFFLMVEGAHIDKKAHNQDEKGSAEALEEFDNAVELALEFAVRDRHTLVVVTADHECGGVILNDDGVYEMTTDGHTGVNVPVRAYGPYEFVADGEIIENIMVPVRIADALELPEGCIPFEVESFPPVKEESSVFAESENAIQTE